MTISKQMHLDPSHMYDHANQHRRINNKYKTEKQPKKDTCPTLLNTIQNAHICHIGMYT